LFHHAGRPRRKPDFTDTNQYRAYQACLLQHFKQHRWLAYIDADEFFVFPQQRQQQEHGGSDAAATDSSSGEQPGILLPSLSQPQQPADNDPHDARDPHDASQSRDAHESHVQQLVLANQLGGLTPQAAAATAITGSNLSPPLTSLDTSASTSTSRSTSQQQQQQQHNLNLFLSDFEAHAAVGVNWVLFGSSGHQTRPAEGPLAAYTSCVPSTHWESTHVKVRGCAPCAVYVGSCQHRRYPGHGLHPLCYSL
jgi:hypothetical protein